MGSKTDAFETSILQHIFQNAAITNIGDAAGVLGSTGAGSLYIALFTTNPSDSSSGVETTYTNYARVAVARTAGAWTITTGSATNASAVTFAQCGTTGATLTGFAIAKASTVSVNDHIYWGALGTNLTVSTGITPEFAAQALVVSED